MEIAVVLGNNFLEAHTFFIDFWCTSVYKVINIPSKWEHLILCFTSCIPLWLLLLFVVIGDTFFLTLAVHPVQVLLGNFLKPPKYLHAEHEGSYKAVSSICLEWQPDWEWSQPHSRRSNNRTKNTVWTRPRAMRYVTKGGPWAGWLADGETGHQEDCSWPLLPHLVRWKWEWHQHVPFVLCSTLAQDPLVLWLLSVSFN